MKDLIDIFLQPGPVLLRQYEKPNGWLPVILISVVGTVFAHLFLLAGKVTGLAVGFKQGLALAGWSSMPGILASLLGIYGTLSMTPQTSINALSYTTVDPMLVQLASESPWKSLAGSFSFLTLWSIGLAALGWKLWSRGGWGAAISIAALPYALIYGFQVIKALMA